MKKPMTAETAYLRISGKCALAELCTHDAKRLMTRWELEPRLQAEVIARLIKEKFIDENRYAHAFVRDKFRYNHWGASRIRMELLRRGIDDSIIEDALAEISDSDNISELRKLIEQKKKTVKAKSDYELRGKLIRFAMTKGFSYNDISKIIDTEGWNAGNDDF